MAEGLYRIGECIYMEVYPPPMPYQICKVEELRKNAKGSVEVAAKCFYRRKDLPANLLAAADRHALAVEEENEMDGSDLLGNQFDKLGNVQKHLIRHRELFLSRQVETYKIDMVRGKCSVSLLNELEDIHTYLDKEDTFYYSMVYDPNQKTLLVDKGEIRTGPDYQAEIPPYIDPEAREPVPHSATLVWEPNRMPDNKVEQFLVVARSIGTFARALLDGAKKPQISLRLGAAAASRDITLFHAMDTLNQNEYDITQATSCLVPRGPVLCADELEAWTQEEAKRFEDGLQEQKDFLSIQRKYLPWKPVKSIVAYYYMWKTTDRYQIQKRHRMIEKQNDLKEVIVHLRTPSGASAGPKDLSGKAASAGIIPTSVPESKTVPIAPDGEKGCESCHCSAASRWYQWGPVHEHCRLCNFCYTYWRKYGGLKLPTKWEAIEKRVTGVAQITSSLPIKKPKERPAGQTRIGKKSSKKDEKRNGDIIPPVPFYMRPTGITLYMRQKLGSAAIQKCARSSLSPISVKDVPKPTARDVEKYMTIHRKGHRKPRLSEPLVASLKQQNVHSPIRMIRPSPTPISPSYKAKAQTNVAKSKITTAGTYVPPKSHPQGSIQQPAASSSQPQSVVSSAPHSVSPVVKQQQAAPQPQPSQKLQPHQQVSTAGIFVPPNGSESASNNRKRKLDHKAPAPGSGNPPANKIFRPSSPSVVSPGEIFFKVDSKTRVAREKLGRTNLLKAARSPNKPVKYRGKDH